MGSSDFSILDVGHGNCALIRGGTSATVVDAPQGSTLAEALEHYKVKTVLAVVISHADSDHVGGVIGLLSDPRFSVKSIYVNPDADKASRIWRDFRIAVRDARKRTKDLRICLGLSTGTKCPSPTKRFELEVVWPTPEIALAGPGGKDLSNRPLRSNTTSAVLKVWSEGKAVAVLCGDLDGTALKNIKGDGIAIDAKVLVFPHHGGLPSGTSPVLFAKELCDLVRPETVVFSMSRTGLENPRREIVDGVFQYSTKTHILCTQLSTNCAKHDPKSPLIHLGAVPSQGAVRGHSCAGSVQVEPAVSHGISAPDAGAHLKFVTANAPTAMCLKLPPTKERRRH